MDKKDKRIKFIAEGFYREAFIAFIFTILTFKNY